MTIELPEFKCLDYSELKEMPFNPLGITILDCDLLHINIFRYPKVSIKLTIRTWKGEKVSNFSDTPNQYMLMLEALNRIVSTLISDIPFETKTIEQQRLGK